MSVELTWMKQSSDSAEQGNTLRRSSGTAVTSGELLHVGRYIKLLFLTSQLPFTLKRRNTAGCLNIFIDKLCKIIAKGLVSVIRQLEELCEAVA